MYFGVFRCFKCISVYFGVYTDPFMDVVKEDMAEVEVTEEDTVDRRNWRKKICCGDP